MLVFLEISMLVLFPKAVTSLPAAMVPCFSPQLLPKLVTPRVTNGGDTLPDFPSRINCPTSTVSPFELVLSRPICFDLSAFTSKVEASYNRRKSVVRKTLPASPVATFYRTLIIFFLDILPLSLYANLLLALPSLPWRVAELLGLCEGSLFLHPSEGVGWHQPSIKPLQK